MATEAQRRARDKWNNEKVEQILFRVPKGMKAEIQGLAKKKGETVNGMLLRLVKNEMDNGNR